MAVEKKSPSFWEKLDPFYYVDEYLMPLLNPWDNAALSWVIYLVFSFIFAFALYSIIGFALQTASPLVIVVSGSMLPTMARGDVVLLHGVDGAGLNTQEVVLDGIDVAKTSLQDLATMQLLENGVWQLTFKATNQTIQIPKQGNTDIVVYVSKQRGIEIIHRAVVKIRSNGQYYLLTKGDNNISLDQDCGKVDESIPGLISTQKLCPSPYPIPLSLVKGKALGWLPYVGFVKLFLFDDLPGILSGKKVSTFPFGQ
ncbi:MAG: hypothetical protein IPJ89_05590 [Candidatus Iainarchaeum archaeon]|uniref:Signal peptidase I n=1 Tax=Candidatus Iainarchaeum sp. TaxID=3101447 RepID=A0A7T9DJQ0_9ARCH|nr:MAG: hypothetical protein IPJ89_05590 [Candidatus Diapherotrites archaeon]